MFPLGTTEQLKQLNDVLKIQYGSKHIDELDGVYVPAAHA
jgi:hypothetical protein